MIRWNTHEMVVMFERMDLTDEMEFTKGRIERNDFKYKG